MICNKQSPFQWKPTVLLVLLFCPFFYLTKVICRSFFVLKYANRFFLFQLKLRLIELREPTKKTQKMSDLNFKFKFIISLVVFKVLIH